MALTTESSRVTTRPSWLVAPIALPRLSAVVSAHVVVVGAAILLAVMAGLVAARLNTLFLSTHPFQGDSSSYYYYQLQAYFTAQRQGAWEAIKDQLATNGRNPLRILPYLVFAPQLLADPNGHLVSSCIMLAAFLALLGITVYRRCGSLPWALVALAVVPSALRFFDPQFGLGFNFPDLPAMFLVGAALLALLNSDEGRSGPWLVAFGTLAALAALARFVTAGYTLVMCGPILAYFLLKRAWLERNVVRGVIVPSILVGLPLVLIAGNFLLKFSAENVRFYSVAGYALGAKFDQVVANIGIGFSLYFGVAGAAALVLIAVFYVLRFGDSGPNWSTLGVTLWAAAAHILLVLFVLRLTEYPEQPLYALPGIYLLALAPFAVKRKFVHPSRTVEWLTSLALIVTLGWVSFQAYREAVVRVASANNYDQRSLKFDQDSAFVLVNNAASIHGRAPVFDTVFFQYGPRIVGVAGFRDKTQLIYSSQFETHMGGWRLRYPDLNEDAIKAEQYALAVKTLDFVLVMPHPRAPEAKILFNNDLSIDVVEDMQRRITADTNVWRLIQPLSSPWGEIDLYQNVPRSST